MRRYTSLTDHRKEQPQIPAGLTIIMLASLAVGIFAAGCLAGINASRITAKNAAKVNFHEIHVSEHYSR